VLKYFLFFNLPDSTKTNNNKKEPPHPPFKTNKIKVSAKAPLYAFGASNSHENHLQALKQL